MNNKAITSMYSIALIGSLIGIMVIPMQAMAKTAQQMDSQFTDLTTDHYAYEAIIWAKSKGIVSGYPDGTFRPNEAITEAQLAKMLAQFLGLQDDKGDLIKHTPASHWSDSYYDSLAAYGTPLNAYFDNKLKVEPVKRGVVAQAISHLTGNVNSLDESINFMMDKGITAGQNPQFEGEDLKKFFGSSNTLTRAQLAVFLYSMLIVDVRDVTGIAVEVHNNKEGLSLVALANKGMNTLDSSLRIGQLGSETPISEPVVEVKEAYIAVKKLMQNPELPNGCEIVSLTAILNYHGYTASKTTMADQYLPKQDFSWKQGKRFGPHPYNMYAGNPRSKTGGWYSLVPPIMQASNKYMATQKNKMTAINITGSSKEELITHLNNGVPVIVWVTLDLSKPRLSGHWYLSDTGEYYKAYTNLHTVVLHGYKEGKVHVMNPLKGHVEYDMNAFFKSYEEMGKRALILEKE